MSNKYLTIENGERKLVEATKLSNGTADAGKIPALGEDGKLDSTMLPDTSVTPDMALAYEKLSAGDFVNLFSNNGVFSVRLADNSNGRNADGFVAKASEVGEAAAIMPLGLINSSAINLTSGSRVYLGTAGKVIQTPLDEKDANNKGFISQLLGKAKSANEIITFQEDYIVL